MADDFQAVYSTNGQLNAESIKILLESAGIQVMLAGESIGTVYGLGIGPLAAIEVLVPASQVSSAREILDAMDKGELELPSQTDNGDDEPETDE